MPKLNPAVADPATITIRVAIAFRRRGGGKTVTTPEGSPTFVPTRTRVSNALIKAMARAFRWRKLLETGVFATVAEIAAVEKINASYLGRILRLTLLAPDIVEAILDGRQPASLQLDALLTPLSSEWCMQRQTLAIGL